MAKENLYLRVSSPEELEQKLSALPAEEKSKKRFLSLSLSGPQVLVRQFSLPLSLTPKEARSSLILEASELLSLHPEEVDLDYQVLEKSGEGARGVFIAVPKRLAAEYSAKVRKAGLIPLEAAATILEATNAFLAANGHGAQSFYFIYFDGGNKVDLAAFEQGNCRLLREIPYENLEEAKREILQSLRYILGKSAFKEPDNFFIAGAIAGKEGLASELEVELSVSFKEAKLPEERPARRFFCLNLFKAYVFSPA